jgi:hypothetical protein
MTSFIIPHHFQIAGKLCIRILNELMRTFYQTTLKSNFSFFISMLNLQVSSIFELFRFKTS